MVVKVNIGQGRMVMCVVVMMKGMVMQGDSRGCCLGRGNSDGGRGGTLVVKQG